VESLQVGEQTVSSWQEAIEREIALGDFDATELLDCPRWVEFGFTPDCTVEPLRSVQGEIIGVVSRTRRQLDGGASIALEMAGEGVYRLTVRIENRSRFKGGADREEALMQALVSTHTILGVERGAFVSLLDPPEPLRSLAAECTNVGTYPVLVGDAGQTDTMLSSPIILYDYPQVAPESPGDLFDATEIDEILTLRIMTLTDDEKRAAAALDVRGRALLERTETLAREQLMGLHGTMRGLRPLVPPEETP
jgi:hydrogenase maturation protease